MTIDLNDPKMSGYKSLEEFTNDMDDSSSRRLRDIPAGKFKESLQIAQGPLVFPNTKVGQESTSMGVVLTSTGYDKVRIFSAIPLGDYVLKSSVPEYLAPGESVSVQIAFAPKATGTRTGGVYFNTGNAAGNEIAMLSGVGVAA